MWGIRRTQEGKKYEEKKEKDDRRKDEKNEEKRWDKKRRELAPARSAFEIRSQRIDNSEA